MAGSFAGAARAAQNQAGSRATGHPFAAVGQDPMDSATAVTQPSQQSFAAALSAVPLDAAVASESAQPSLVQPHSDSVVASELLVHSSADVPLIVTSIGESQPQPVDLTGLVATAVDSSEHTQEPVQGLADPNKRLFAKMGCEVPGHVSMQLLQEVGARSHVQGLLQVRLAVDVPAKHACVNVQICHHALLHVTLQTISLLTC